MKPHDLYFLIITLTALAVVISAGFYSSNVQQVSSTWNYQQLALFSHEESNFTFTYSGDERDDEGNFSKMISSINSNYPHVLFNINGGDLRSQPMQLNKFRSDYLNPGKINHFNKPVIFVIGNHELQNDPTESIYQSIFGSPTYYSFTENSSYFIVIDNANGESLNDTQMNWLKKQLNQSQNYKYRFIFMHLPLYTPPGEEDGEEHSMTAQGHGGADVLKSLFDYNNVTMIFASHMHNYYQGTWGKTHFIISGGAGAPPEIDHPPNHHYIVVDVADKGMDYSVVYY